MIACTTSSVFLWFVFIGLNIISGGIYNISVINENLDFPNLIGTLAYISAFAEYLCISYDYYKDIQYKGYPVYPTTFLMVALLVAAAHRLTKMESVFDVLYNFVFPVLYLGFLISVFL